FIPFAFFGLESYTRSVRGAEDVATVDGSGISQREFAEEMRRQHERLRAMLGRDFDVSAFDTPEMRLSVLESMISERLVAAEVARSNLILSREAAVAEIMKAPEFQDQGKFSAERYQGYLRSRGLSDEANVALLRHELPLARLAGAVSGSSIQSRSVAERLLALEEQRREVAEALLASDQFLAQVKPDEAQLKAHYDANAAQFRTPERVRAEYLLLSAEELGRSEPVPEEEIKAAYQARASQFAVEEQRRASHILVKSKDEAEKLAAEAKKSPARFAELARKHSQDPGSAGRGGDLGLLGRGDVVKPFADAVFRMKEGEIAGPVETEFGFHVIRLSAVQPGKGRTLEEVRAELGAEIARQKGAKRFAAEADAFNNIVYEQSDTLKPAAERYKLKLQTSGWITRAPSPELGPLGHPKLLAALFSSDAIQQRRNTDAIEVAPGVLVAARVAEHQPAAQRKFEDVKPEVEQRLRRGEAAKLAQKEGAAKLEQLARGDEAGIRWSAAKTVSRREARDVAPDALRRIMAADASRLPAYVGVNRGEQGYALYRITKVVSPEPKAEPQKTADLARIDRQAGDDQLAGYVASLRARAKVEINKANLERK
ncbi:MAG: peptidyl-prolyl cis-trans isomerase, partial [Burkholderiales bacterium]